MKTFHEQVTKATTENNIYTVMPLGDVPNTYKLNTVTDITRLRPLNFNPLILIAILDKLMCQVGELLTGFPPEKFFMSYSFSFNSLAR